MFQNLLFSIKQQVIKVISMIYKSFLAFAVSQKIIKFPKQQFADSLVPDLERLYCI